MSIVRFERRDGVGHIVLANPPLNLVATRFSDCLREAVHQASDGEIRSLLVRAEGPNFSAGGDVLDFIDKDFNSWRTFISKMHHSYRAIAAPVAGAVQRLAVPGADSVLLDITMGLHGTDDARRGRTARAEAMKRGTEPEPVVFAGR